MKLSVLLFSFFGFAETGKTDRVGDRHREGNAVGFAFKSRFGINRTKNLVFGFGRHKDDDDFLFR